MKTEIVRMDTLKVGDKILLNNHIHSLKNIEQGTFTYYYFYCVGVDGVYPFADNNRLVEKIITDESPPSISAQEAREISNNALKNKYEAELVKNKQDLENAFVRIDDEISTQAKCGYKLVCITKYPNSPLNDILEILNKNFLEFEKKYTDLGYHIETLYGDPQAAYAIHWGEWNRNKDVKE